MAVSVAEGWLLSACHNCSRSFSGERSTTPGGDEEGRAWSGPARALPRPMEAASGPTATGWARDPSPLHPSHGQRGWRGPRLRSRPDGRQAAQEAGRDAHPGRGTTTRRLRDVSHLMEKHHPHLVLLDLVLPGVDGIDLMQDQSKTSNAPVIFLSAYGQDEVIARAFDAGVVNCMIKPFSPTELPARIRAALRKRTPSWLT